MTASHRQLFLLFNHRLTPLQKQDAFQSLSIESIQEPTPAIKKIWGQIPPDLPTIADYLKPVQAWLLEKAAKGDYVLIQGDFGACFILVSFAFDIGLIPVYSTTQREAVETAGNDGAVKITHQFKHRIFRKYEL